MTNLLRVRATTLGWNGAPGLNTFYFSSPDFINSDNEDAVLCVDRVHAAFTAGKGLFKGEWRCQVSDVVDVIDDATGDLVKTLVGNPKPEITGGPHVKWGPTPVMMILQLKTATINDGSRIAGRAFLGPLGDGADEDGTPPNNQIASAVAMGVALMDKGNQINPDLAVWRRPRAARAAGPGNPPKPTAQAQRAGASGIVVGAITVPNKFAVLRSRRD